MWDFRNLFKRSGGKPMKCLKKDAQGNVISYRKKYANGKQKNGCFGSGPQRTFDPDHKFVTSRKVAII